MSKPIDAFTSEEQAQECLKWWKHKLFLDNWIIKLNINCAPSDLVNDNVTGENEFQIENKASVIRMVDQKYYGDRIMKFCAEKVLVHELLHCKYNWIARNDTIEGKYFDVLEHQLLEDMARSLVMAKYDIDMDYFNNL